MRERLAPYHASGHDARQATTLAIVLGRAGSRGVPGKNTMPIAGRPCVAWTIEHAMRSLRVGMVVVSSDCPVTLDVAQRMGAWTIARPPELAGDDARIDDAARHALGEVDRAYSRLATPGHPSRLDSVAILYANVPVRPHDLTDRAIETLAQTQCDSVQSYAAAGKHHPWWTARVDPDTGAIAPWQGRVLNHGVYRRQDLPPAFVPDGGVIVLTRDALACRVRGAGDGPHAFFGRDRRGIISGTGQDGIGVIDIDAPLDAIVADAVLRMRLASTHAGWSRAC